MTLENVLGTNPFSLRGQPAGLSSFDHMADDFSGAVKSLISEAPKALRRHPKTALGIVAGVAVAGVALSKMFSMPDMGGMSVMAPSNAWSSMMNSFNAQQGLSLSETVRQ